MSDNEDATAALWNSGKLSVKNPVGEPIPAFAQEPEEGSKIPSSVTRQEAGDVLEYHPAGPTAEATVRALGDERGGVFTGLPLYPSEFSSTVDFTRRSAAGDVLPGGVDVGQQGIEFAPRGDGGMFVASFKPSGATGPCEADAYISVSQSDPGAGFHESKPLGAETATR